MTHASQACKNAGGWYLRNPCSTLKQAIEDCGPRFDLTLPTNGNAPAQPNIAYMNANMEHNNFTKLFDATTSGCLKICKSLPKYANQTRMLTVPEHSDSLDWDWNSDSFKRIVSGTPTAHLVTTRNSHFLSVPVLERDMKVKTVRVTTTRQVLLLALFLLISEILSFISIALAHWFIASVCTHVSVGLHKFRREDF